MIVDSTSKYYFSKTAILFMTLIYVIVYSLVIFVMIVTYNIKVEISIICLILILFLILTMSRYYRFLILGIKRMPALVLTREKLVDNINRQVYKWSDIDQISIQYNSAATPGKFIAINVKDTAKYISHIQNPWNRFIARMNKKYFYGTFAIPSNSLKCSLQELISDLHHHHSEYS